MSKGRRDIGKAFNRDLRMGGKCTMMVFRVLDGCMHTCEEKSIYRHGWPASWNSFDAGPRRWMILDIK